MLVCGALIRLRNKSPAQDYFKVRYGIPLAIAGMAATIWLLSSTQMQEIQDMALWTILGFVIFGAYKVIAKISSIGE